MHNKRILCVDDDESTRELLTTMLGMSDLEAITAHDMNSALLLMEHEEFSLYTVDGQMLGESGLNLCRRIRAVDKNTPIVIFSGHGYKSDIEAGMLAGANAYIVKPDTAEFVATIKRLLAPAAGAAP